MDRLEKNIVFVRKLPEYCSKSANTFIRCESKTV